MSATDISIFASAPTAGLPPELVHPENRPELARQDLGFLFSRIMILDDEPVNVKVAHKYLRGAGYVNFITSYDSTTAMALIEKESPDLLLLDIMMPVVNGLEILEQVRAHEKFKHLPVVILTASTDSPTKLKALNLGATDFLPKPIDPHELLPRVRNVLSVKAHQDHLARYSEELEEQVRKRTVELEMSRLRVFQCLARAGEYRDDTTGQHVIRVGRCVATLAAEFGYDKRRCDTLELAAQLHDIGKIGVPDSILLKPGKLDSEEFALMRKHCAYGKAIIDPTTDNEAEVARQYTKLGISPADQSDSPLLAMAAMIALTHHERFDGNGYPNRVKGTDIPLEGRLTAVADTFDALMSPRPYKPAFDLAQCARIIREGRGTHFDPAVVDAFDRRLADLAEIHRRHSDGNKAEAACDLVR
jgi:putative two-component system response regulator